MISLPTMLRRSLVAFLALVVLFGFQDTLVRSIRCARANATHHAQSTPSGSDHLARTQGAARADAAAADATRLSASSADDLPGGSGAHHCPTPLAATFVEPTVAQVSAPWSRTTISTRAPPEPTRHALDPVERPPRSERGLLSA